MFSLPRAANVFPPAPPTSPSITFSPRPRRLPSPAPDVFPAPLPNVCNAAPQAPPPRTCSPALVLLHPRWPARTHLLPLIPSPSQAPRLAEPSDFETSALTCSRWLRASCAVHPSYCMWPEEERERDRK
ncbi:hypothetical protein B0H16DRAFT_1740687 [Mycena metata]|uniref:Uncharacterized protein n=1 Tax=Mycena metata TaxID=1033252 RepID=A0AAD7HC33_9AGAR|nr:hypothetical protein B0H16DRAFT_1740687 [Mycena metata]